MAKINTPEELRLMREKLRADLEIRENSNTPTLPGRRPVLYGHVTAERVAELVERQIVRGETAEGLIEA